SSAAVLSEDGEVARAIAACAPAMASLRPSPVMLLTPVFGEAAPPSWPRWRRMGRVSEPIRPVPPITTIFIPNLLVRSPQAGPRGFVVLLGICRYFFGCGVPMYGNSFRMSV